MRKSWYIVLVTLILTITLSYGCTRRGVEISNPKIPVTVKEDQIVKSILNGMSDRGWIMTSKESGHIVAHLDARKHQVVIDILYDAKEISFNYKSSENLRYSETDGKQYIHKRYNSWINNLAKDIQLEMQRSSQE